MFLILKKYIDRVHNIVFLYLLFLKNIRARMKCVYFIEIVPTSRECLVELAWAISEKLLAKMFTVISLVAAN